MGLRSRLALLLLVLVAGLAVTGAVMVDRLADVDRSGSVVVTEVQPAVATTNTVTLDVLEVQTLAARYALSRDAADRRALEDADGRVRDDLTLLNDQTAPDPGSAEAAATLRDAYAKWIAQVVTPSTAAIAAGDAQEARAVVSSPQARDDADAVRTALAGMQSAVLAWRADATAQTATAVDQLRAALGAALLLLLLIAGLLWWGLRRWVTDPLEALSADLVRVADGDLLHTVRASGPPEVLRTGQAADGMRRRLLAEIDEAVAAREALDQRGPVVAALRRELRPSPPPPVDGLDIDGILVPAEGMLAGDWFDARTTADGRLAILLADVSGHGPLAGLLALTLKYAMGAALDAGGGPRSAIEAAADALAGEDERFATALCLTIARDGDLVWCSAGHPAATTITRRGAVERLGPTGPLLSGLGGRWTTGRAVLAPGATLLAMSDGLLESRDGDGVELAEAWTDADLVDFAQRAGTARELVQSLVDAARARTARWRADDLTVVAVRSTRPRT